MKNSYLTVGIINLGFNNLFSIYKACIQSGYKTSIITEKQKTYKFDIVIIPGVGTFKSGMNTIKKNHYDEKVLDYLSKQNAFVYGICLGMQLLFEKSFEFGLTKGLGLIKGNVLQFKKKINSMKTNIGWGQTEFIKKSPLGKKKNYNGYYYFVHSYYANPINNLDIFAKTYHENFLFASVVKRDKILGTQFHPEKSGKLGLEFLKNLGKFKS